MTRILLSRKEKPRIRPGMPPNLSFQGPLSQVLNQWAWEGTGVLCQEAACLVSFAGLMRPICCHHLLGFTGVRTEDEVTPHSNL
eukprot:520409-Amphidinium_carterae.1